MSLNNTTLTIHSQFTQDRTAITCATVSNRKPAFLWLGHLTWKQSGAADSLPVVVPLCRPQMLLKALRLAIVLPSERNWARIDLPLQLISAK